MPVISICLNGSAVDAGTAVTWSLVEAEQKGYCVVEYDQVTFLLEVRSLNVSWTNHSTFSP